MTWSQDDPTLQQPIPVPAAVELRAAGPADHARTLALMALVAFIIGAASSLFALFALYQTADRLMAVPMCQEAK